MVRCGVIFFVVLILGSGKARVEGGNMKHWKIVSHYLC
jgi:hypothetical protein